MHSLQGYFVIASRHLHDPNFAQSVVLLLEHHDEGALGLIVNRPTQRTVREVWKLIDASPCHVEGPLLLGGPVQGPLMCLSGHAEHSDAQIKEGIYLTSQREKLRQLLAANRPPLRVFAGYAGWGAGQLESELEVGGWLIHTATAELTFSEPHQLWKRTVRLAGREFYRQALRLSRFPDDTSCN